MPALWRGDGAHGTLRKTGGTRAGNGLLEQQAATPHPMRSETPPKQENISGCRVDGTIPNGRWLWLVWTPICLSHRPRGVPFTLITTIDMYDMCTFRI